MRVLVEPVELKADQRGCVWEPLAAAQLGDQSNCHVVITLPGGIRGNHFHKIGTEQAIQGGPALVRFRDESGEHSVEIAAGEFIKFTIPPECPHAFQNNGEMPNLLVAFNTELFRPESPDVYPEALIRP